MAGIQIFKKAFTTCKKKKKKAEKYPFFLHRMPLEEFPIAVFFFPFRQKVAKSWHWVTLLVKISLSKNKSSNSGLGGEEGRGETDWLLFEWSYTKTDTN